MFELDKMLRSISIDDQQEIWLARTEAFWRFGGPCLQFMARDNCVPGEPG
jgi:hypothetical protein